LFLYDQPVLEIGKVHTVENRRLTRVGEPVLRSLTIVSMNAAHLWAKTSPYPGEPEEWHPLLLHLVDVAAAAEAILEREPATTRERIGAILGLEWQDARPWLLFLIACHDIGKAGPTFQSLWSNSPAKLQLPWPTAPQSRVSHGVVGQVFLERFLKTHGWPQRTRDLVSDAVGCHHGSRAGSREQEAAELELSAGSPLVAAAWDTARMELAQAILGLFRPTAVVEKERLDGADFMLLAGLTSFADWIGSNEDWFRFGAPGDCADLSSWFVARSLIARQALDGIGWAPRTPLRETYVSFEDAIRPDTRPLQVAVAKSVDGAATPPVILVEAAMGEGKTEAAFYAHLELQRRFGHRGMYVALPTKATGDAMFKRTEDFLRAQGSTHVLDLQLIHGATLLNPDFQRLRSARIGDNDKAEAIHAAEWFTSKKRALLSEYGVGTIDQALMTILPVRHQFVRLWGLANRVVILDEVHAYDAYTGTLLLHLVEWLQALGSSVVMLSATLPPRVRRSLADVTGSALPDSEAAYPRVTVFERGREAQQLQFTPAADRSLPPVRIISLDPGVDVMRDAVQSSLGDGTALCLVNTVQRAQDLYLTLPDGEPLHYDGGQVGKTLPDGTQVLLFHARYPALERQRRAEAVLAAFGSGTRPYRRAILIATQVAEQSLDLDFDLLVTDLAPIDLLLQRAGRLWRHNRADRPLSDPRICIAGLKGETAPQFGRPLFWNKVYDEALLLRTWLVLKAMDAIRLPEQIEPLVNEVYEGELQIPADLAERLTAAELDAEGKRIGATQHGHGAVVGLARDGSWNNQPGRFLLYDDEEPGMDSSLLARTRLGEDAVTVVPIGEDGRNVLTEAPTAETAMTLYLRSLSVSRQKVVAAVRRAGIPDSWTRVPLLRNCYPLLLNADGSWIENSQVRLDAELGLVYEQAVRDA
jgi:CRISPR-associated endonuclease/helicase Cas3